MLYIKNIIKAVTETLSGILCTSLLARAVDDTIILKNGSKSTIKASSFRVDSESISVNYITSSNIKMNLKFSEFESAEFGKNKSQVIKSENNVPEGYYVLTETDNKKLS